MFLTFSRKIPERFFRKVEFSETIFRNVPELRNKVPEISGVQKKNSFRNLCVISELWNLFHIMEMEKKIRIISVRKL